MLEILQKNKKAIKLTELAAFLHDLDKMEGEFLDNPAFHQSPHKLGKNKDKRLCSEIKKERWQKYFDIFNYDIFLENINLEKISSVEDLEINKNYLGKLSSPFVFHHSISPKIEYDLLSLIVHAGACGADGIDSELDKNSIAKQTGSSFKIDTPFGIESSIWESKIEEVIKKVKDVSIDNYEKINIQDFKELFQTTLGETRYPCNDVTLWDHSYSVASLSKAILAKILIEVSGSSSGYVLPHRYDRRKKQIKEFDTTDFTFFKVTVDLDYLLMRANKTGDIWGMIKQVEELQNIIRKYVENELLVGNLTYSDEKNQVFLIPKLATWKKDGQNVLPENLQDDFESEIQRKLNKKIEDWLIRNNANEIPFGIEFADWKSSENEKNVANRLLARTKDIMTRNVCCKQSANVLLQVKDNIKKNTPRCEVCGIRTITDYKEKICIFCKSRRSDTSINKSRNSKKNHTTSNLSRLINSKEENKLVLISASFDLSKLYDCSIFEKVPCLDKENKKPQKNPSLGRLHRSYDTLKLFFEKFQDNTVSKIAKEGYFPIITSPKRMEFVVTGKYAEEIIQELYKQYQIQFGKFRNALPINIGAIFFYKKFPLYAVLEAEQNMQNSFKTQIRKYECEKQIVDNEFLNKVGDMVSPANWIINKELSNEVKEPDGQIHKEDRFHKLDFSETFMEGNFDFVLLDSAVRRNCFLDGKIEHHIFKYRKHYPISVLSDLKKIWDLLDNLNKNQIGIIENQLCEKIASWNDCLNPNNEIFKKFCEMIIMSPNAFGKTEKKKDKDRSIKLYYSLLNEFENEINNEFSNKNILVNSAANGLLLDVIDLYIHILNKK